jgi:hypothetical protein
MYRLPLLRQRQKRCASSSIGRLRCRQAQQQVAARRGRWAARHAPSSRQEAARPGQAVATVQVGWCTGNDSAAAAAHTHTPGGSSKHPAPQTTQACITAAATALHRVHHAARQPTNSSSRTKRQPPWALHRAPRRGAPPSVRAQASGRRSMRPGLRHRLRRHQMWQRWRRRLAALVTTSSRVTAASCCQRWVQWGEGGLLGQSVCCEPLVSTRAPPAADSLARTMPTGGALDTSQEARPDAGAAAAAARGTQPPQRRRGRAT